MRANLAIRLGMGMGLWVFALGVLAQADGTVSTRLPGLRRWTSTRDLPLRRLGR